MEICERRRRERSKGGFSFVSPFLHSSYKKLLSSFFFQRNCWFMGTNMKGIKGFYKGITNMFVVKERELEIGYPTDVKHVAHIGWDGQADNNAPTWMKEFKTSADFSALNVGELGVGEGGGVSLSGRDFQQPMRSSDVHNESSSVKSMKKYKRKKIKSETSSPRSSSTRSSRTKTKFTKAFVEMESATTV